MVNLFVQHPTMTRIIKSLLTSLVLVMIGDALTRTPYLLIDSISFVIFFFSFMFIFR